MALILMLALPVAAAIIMGLIPEGSRRAWRVVAVLAAAAELGLAIWLLVAFAGKQDLSVRFEWLPSFQSSFFLDLDGLSLSLVFLTALLTLLAVIGSLTAERPRERLYFGMILVLEAALVGVFTARDFIPFYVFWEAVLVPMYFLIGIWGSENREYAAVKFFIYTFVGSVLMLLGVLLVYFSGAAGSFDFVTLSHAAERMEPAVRALAFWLIFVGFAVKLPSFPFHTWLPDAHVQAPTAASVLLAGVLLKMGGYGLIRFNLAMFSDLVAKYRWYLLAFAVVSIVYGALLAFAQRDMKRLVAYSSIAHMGFVTAGVAAANPLGVAGAAFVMWAHGLITGLLFFLVGMSYERFHSRSMDEVRGLAVTVPELGWGFVLASIASLGMPGMAGFVGEFMSIVGSFGAFGYWAAAVAAGVLLNATYLLKLLRESIFSPGFFAEGEPGALKVPERIVLWVLIVGTVGTGLYPESVMYWVRPALAALMRS